MLRIYVAISHGLCEGKNDLARRPKKESCLSAGTHGKVIDTLKYLLEFKHRSTACLKSSTEVRSVAGRELPEKVSVPY